MSVPRRLAEEMLESLRFFKAIGVNWVRTGHEATSGYPAGSVGPDATSKRDLFASKKNSAKSSPRILAPTPSIFDTAPMPHETLEAIRKDLGDCQRCKLAPTRRTIVYGSGNPHAELMFVGEAPGADEDEQGLPFVGRAGQLLTKIIESIGMRREEVYICNILKCRPPGNRNPESDEIASCEPFLLRQIVSVKPKVICALGTFGAQTLLRTKEPISRIRGQFIDYRGAKFMATFHPAYLLRNPDVKRKVWEDVQKIRDYLRSSSTAQ